MSEASTKKYFQVKGMHCSSCEILIEDELKKVTGVQRVKADHRKGVVQVVADQKVDEHLLVKGIKNVGYTVGMDSKSFISKNLTDYKDLFISILILIPLYLLLKAVGLFNLNVASGQNLSSLSVVVLVGLTAGFSTCMALVGGLVLSISAQFAKKHPELTTGRKITPHLFFNLGRVIGFFILGGLIGVIGSVFQLSGVSLGLLTIIVGLVMLVLGLQLTGIFPWLEGKTLTLPTGLSRFLGIKGTDENEYSHWQSFGLGALTFFLPCGFTQAMQLFAMSSGNFVTGALTMGLFALGTVPGLLSIGGLTSFIKGNASKKFFKFAGVVVISLSLFNISNGINLTGLSNPFESRAKASSYDANVTLANGIQTVRMTQTANGYSPNTFIIQRNIPVRWLITSEDPNSCSGSILSSKLGIRKTLKAGENVLEFTPKETGTIKFSCMMGMYQGTFVVTDGSSTSTNSSSSNSNSSISGGHSCGGGSVNGSTSTGTQNTAGSCGSGGCGCGGSAVKNNTTSPTPAPTENTSNTQIIKTTYTVDSDIVPNQFNVKLNSPVRMEITVKEQSYGCMSTITIPGLTSQVESLDVGKTVVLEFTPKKTGSFNITCAMGVPRGKIIVE